MLSATGSTGFRNGTEAFIFFSERMVDMQNRCWATLSVDTFDLLASKLFSAASGGGDTDAGGGVAVFNETTNIFKLARPLRRTGRDKRTLANEAWSASECFLALLAGGGCISSSLGELLEYGEVVSTGIALAGTAGSEEEASETSWLGAEVSASAMGVSSAGAD